MPCPEWFLFCEPWETNEEWITMFFFYGNFYPLLGARFNLHRRQNHFCVPTWDERVKVEFGSRPVINRHLFIRTIDWVVHYSALLSAVAEKNPRSEERRVGKE